jgi:hypothetical protein
MAAADMVFVSDSQPHKLEETIANFKNLKENLEY